MYDYLISRGTLFIDNVLIDWKLPCFWIYKYLTKLNPKPTCVAFITLFHPSCQFLIIGNHSISILYEICPEFLEQFIYRSVARFVPGIRATVKYSLSSPSKLPVAQYTISISPKCCRQTVPNTRRIRTMNSLPSVEQDCGES